MSRNLLKSSTLSVSASQFFHKLMLIRWQYLPRWSLVCQP
jgi:hypothetical protein